MSESSKVSRYRWRVEVLYPVLIGLGCALGIFWGHP